jgi:hypothetical protein
VQATLVAELPDTPMILRIGGSAADSLWWQPPHSTASPTPERIVMTAEVWDEMIGFVRAAGFELVWDLNGMGLRKGGFPTSSIAPPPRVARNRS